MAVSLAEATLIVELVDKLDKIARLRVEGRHDRQTGFEQDEIIRLKFEASEALVSLFTVREKDLDGELDPPGTGG